VTGLLYRGRALETRFFRNRVVGTISIFSLKFQMGNYAGKL